MKKEKKLWFVNKTYGWGWTPASLEGWLVIIIFVVFQIWNSLRLDAAIQSNPGAIRTFLIQTFLAVLVLIFICYKKGEKPQWRWGKGKYVIK